jgi:phosphoribosylglycinamide formyltransferase 1
MSKNWASFVSGGGTTFENMAMACKNKEVIGITPSLVVASKPGIAGIDRANKLDIPVVVIERKNFSSQEEFGVEIIRNLKEYNIDFITQNGWLPLTPENVIESYKNNIYNQHPGPVPEFGGKGMHGIFVHAARINFAHLVDRDYFTYAVAHRVTSEFDRGAIVKKIRIDFDKNCIPEDLAQLVLPLEHRLQIDLLNDIAHNSIKEYPQINLVKPGELHLLEKAKSDATKSQ